MKAIPLVLLALLSLATSAWAGEIYGAIKEGSQPVKKALVEIKAPNNKAYPGSTDDLGNYRIIVEETGKCTITVQFNGQSAQGEVQSYPTPVRFNWLVEKSGSGYSLKPQ
ncbi:MAG TPA: hypothetical protein VLH83_10385 [Chthoniobacterales bacterium]|nr:hypothetical protein [Chthoniobacterales bacterium]